MISLAHLTEHNRLRRHLADLLVCTGYHAEDLAALVGALLTSLVEHVLRFDLAFKTWVEEARH